MAMTTEERQSIINTVLSAIRTNSRTIGQLTPVTSLNDNSYFEIDGGKRISFSILKSIFTSLNEQELDSIRILIHKNAIHSIKISASGNNAVLSVSSGVKTIVCEVPIATLTHAGFMTAGDKALLKKLHDDFQNQNNQFLSKDKDDHTNHKLTVGDTLTAQNGAQFGPDFAAGSNGCGGYIDANGDGYFGNLHLRGYLDADIFRYSRTDVVVGNMWNAPGGGIIKEVKIDTDENGQLLPSGIITLNLEVGEYGAIAYDDICHGIYHDWLDTDTNSTINQDDSCGNFLFVGYRTVYFRVTEILESRHNSQFRYELRPISEKWPYQYHPSVNMHFVGYGNFSTEERQQSRYATKTYERYLRHVNTWEFGVSNIVAQVGDLTNLIVHGLHFSGYSVYVSSENLPLRMEVDVQGMMPIAFGETLPVRCSVMRGFDDLTAQVVRWEVARDTGSPQDDAVWGLSSKAKSFAGSIDLCWTAAENDIGMPSPGVTTLFTFTAWLADNPTPAVMELTVG